MYWLNKIRVDLTVSLAGNNSHTVVNYSRVFHETIGLSLTTRDTVIGRNGIIVQTDEC